MTKKLLKTALQNNEYWSTNFQDVVTTSVKSSQVYEGPLTVEKLANSNMMITIEDIDVVSSIMKESLTDNQSHVGVLNFASYTSPGGGYIRGSMAQEEALCHSSFLYLVLREFEDDFYKLNRQDVNDHMYYDRGIYSPNVMFKNKEDALVKADVLTIASPNLRYSQHSQPVNSNYLKSRIKFVLDMAEDNGVDTLILGAFGCGVFQQNPHEVANFFKSLLPSYSFKKVVFAIIDDERGENLKPFVEIFNVN